MLKIIALNLEAFEPIKHMVLGQDFSAIDEIFEKYRLDRKSSFLDKSDELIIHAEHEAFLYLNDDEDSHSAKIIEGLPFIEDEFHWRYLKYQDAKDAYEFYVSQNFLAPSIFVTRFRNKVIRYEESICTLIDQFLPDRAVELMEKTEKLITDHNNESENKFKTNEEEAKVTIELEPYIRIYSCYSALKKIDDYYKLMLRNKDVWFYIH